MFKDIFDRFRGPEDKKLKAVISEFGSETQYSPDVPNLEPYKAIPYFAYGSEMKIHRSVIEGGMFEKVLGDASDLESTAYTVGSFCVWRYGAEAVAFGTRNFCDSEPGKIRGELHKVSSEAIYALDTFKKNGVLYKRVKVQIIKTIHAIPIGDETMWAWTHIGIPEAWKQITLTIEVVELGGYRRRTRTFNKCAPDDGVSLEAVKLIRPNADPNLKYFFLTPGELQSRK